MPPKNTKKPSPNTDPASTTAELSQASESSGHLTKGEQSENLVMLEFLKLGFSLYRRREKVLGVEVDLLFSRRGVLHLVEVKSFPSLSSKQLRRLKRAAFSLEVRHRSSVRLHLAVVKPNASIEIHWDIGDEVQLNC